MLKHSISRHRLRDSVWGLAACGCVNSSQVALDFWSRLAAPDDLARLAYRSIPSLRPKCNGTASIFTYLCPDTTSL